MECPVSHLIGTKKTIRFAKIRVSPGSQNKQVIKFENTSVKGHANQHYSSRYRGSLNHTQTRMGERIRFVIDSLDRVNANR
jgi:hypothetical protein